MTTKLIIGFILVICASFVCGIGVAASADLGFKKWHKFFLALPILATIGLLIAFFKIWNPTMP